MDHDLWQNRRFKRLWFAHATTSVGDTMVEVALVFAALDLGASPTGVGLTLGALALAPILFLFIGGVIGDRFARDRVVVSSHFARATIQALVAALLLAGGPLTALITLVFLYGAAEAFYSPASTALLPEIVERGKIQAANASLAVVRRTIGIVGPGAAGFVIAFFGTAWVFAIDAVSFVVAALLYRSIATGSKQGIEATSVRELVADIRVGWAEFSTRRWLWVSVLVFSISGVAMVPLFTLGPIAASDLELGEASWGICVGVASVGSVVGSLAAGWFTFRAPLLFAFLMVTLLALPLLALGLTSSIIVVAASLTIAWGAAAMANTVWATVLQSNVPQDRLARVSSFDYWGSLVLTPLAFAVVGPVAEFAGRDQTLVGGAVLLVAVTLLGVVLSPDIRRVRIVTQAAVGEDDEEPDLAPS
ncbi:MAG: MFS transporter [Mycobacterium sp.]